MFSFSYLRDAGVRSGLQQQFNSNSTLFTDTLFCILSFLFVLYYFTLLFMYMFSPLSCSAVSSWISPVDMNKYTAHLPLRCSGSVFECTLYGQMYADMWPLHHHVSIHHLTVATSTQLSRRFLYAVALEILFTEKNSMSVALCIKWAA